MKMKFPLLALALLLPGISHAADDAAQTRARYAAVNKSASKATVVKRDLEGYSLEGGDLTAYFQRGVPLKMRANFYGESGKASEEYYFWRGRLFFILRTSWHYGELLGAATDFSRETKLVRNQAQERWYFKNGELQRWIRPSGETLTSGALFKNQEENYLTLTRQMLAGARGKATTIIAPVH